MSLLVKAIRNGTNIVLAMERESDGERIESVGAFSPEKVNAPPPRNGKPSDKGLERQMQDKQGQRKGLTTFYFSGVQEMHSDRFMWKVFQRWGRVWDVYMPGKVNRQGERFGFVRFMEVREPKKLELELQTLTIGSVRIQVNLPKHARVRKGFQKNYQAQDVSRNGYQRAGWRNSRVENGKSFAEVVKQYRPEPKV